MVFPADGAHHNWDMQATNFPESVGILDFYHASERTTIINDTLHREFEPKSMRDIHYAA